MSEPLGVEHMTVMFADSDGEATLHISPVSLGELVIRRLADGALDPLSYFTVTGSSADQIAQVQTPCRITITFHLKEDAERTVAIPSCELYFLTTPARGQVLFHVGGESDDWPSIGDLAWSNVRLA